ncbi:MAG TPA: hypothetical protein VFB59_04180 [Candidatus Saccharimonadales bacterium]|nr:hypothetical protein [Candidatus Saccharimonadales bacterium]
MANLEIFGDSITYGIGDPEGGGWAERIRKTMIARMDDYHTTNGKNIIYNSSKRGIFTFNNSENGMILPNIVDCLPNIFDRRARRGYHGRLFVAVMAGFSEHNAPSLQPALSLDGLKYSLQSFTGKLELSRYNVCRLFVELPPFDFNRPRPLNRGNISADRLATYQDTIKHHANETGGHYIPIADALRQLPEDPISHDGVHPSTVGQAAIANIVLGKIDELLGPRIDLEY